MKPKVIIPKTGPCQGKICKVIALASVRTLEGSEIELLSYVPEDKSSDTLWIELANVAVQPTSK
jgi:hypothetical protein